MQASTAASLAQTVYAIARSPAVAEYTIGVTTRPNLRRRAEHRADRGYDHLVVLADNLSRATAQRIEECLQNYMRTADLKTLAVYQKYEKTRRNDRYYASLGQAQEGFSVYMAWRE